MQRDFEMVDHNLYIQFVYVHLHVIVYDDINLKIVYMISYKTK